MPTCIGVLRVSANSHAASLIFRSLPGSPITVLHLSGAGDTTQLPETDVTHTGPRHDRPSRAGSPDCSGDPRDSRPPFGSVRLDGGRPGRHGADLGGAGVRRDPDPDVLADVGPAQPVGPVVRTCDHPAVAQPLVAHRGRTLVVGARRA